MMRKLLLAALAAAQAQGALHRQWSGRKLRGEVRGQSEGAR